MSVGVMLTPLTAAKPVASEIYHVDKGSIVNFKWKGGKEIVRTFAFENTAFGNTATHKRDRKSESVEETETHKARISAPFCLHTCQSFGGCIHSSNIFFLCRVEGLGGTGMVMGQSSRGADSTSSKGAKDAAHASRLVRWLSGEMKMSWMVRTTDECSYCAGACVCT